jgi:hypothetical protein
VHKLLAGSPKPDKSNVKGQMVPHIAGGGLSMRLMTAARWKILRLLRKGL